MNKIIKSEVMHIKIYQIISSLIVLGIKFNEQPHLTGPS